MKELDFSGGPHKPIRMKDDDDSKHTPGSWYWDFDRDDMASLRSEGDNESIMIDIACYPSLEDRCLIAAAPDLLEALQSLVKTMRSPPTGPNMTHEFDIGKAEQAINKALTGATK